MMRVLRLFLLLYILLVSLFSVLIISVHWIPFSSIRNNVIESAKTLQDEGMFPQYKDYRFTRLDNYTDALMLNIAISAEEDNPVESSMMNYYYDYLEDEDIEKSYHTERVARNELNGLTKISYGRYWQGYLITLRPLLCFFSLSGIRILNYLCLSILLVSCLYLIVRKIGWIEAVIFGLALLPFNIPLVPYSLQFSTCFYWMFLSSIALLAIPQLSKTALHLGLTFFAIGAITVYFDFLTTPQLTLGIPLILVMLSKKTDTPFVFVLSAIAAWYMGYGILWASKWGVAYLLTQNNLLESAIEQARLRTSHLYHQQPMTIHRMKDYLFPSISMHNSYKIAGIFAGIALIYLKLQRGIKVQIRYFWLLIIAAFVPVWFLVMRQHSIEHRYFTMRAFVVTLYAVFIWIYYTIVNPNKQ